ncbi:MAG: hypothetical protein SFT90_07180 [Rickettsiales bacterium]|nr:hypothetical protein [Rickettsiales bacterium]
MRNKETIRYLNPSEGSFINNVCLKLEAMLNKIILLIITFFTFANEAYSKTEEIPNCSELHIYLSECKKFKCVTKTSKNINIVNEIEGLNSKRKCIHSQLIDNKDKIVCNYSKYSRKFIAMNIIENKNSPEKLLDIKSQDEEMKTKLSSEIFSNECKFIPYEKK